MDRLEQQLYEFGASDGMKTTSSPRDLNRSTQATPEDAKHLLAKQRTGRGRLEIAGKRRLPEVEHQGFMV